VNINTLSKQNYFKEDDLVNNFIQASTVRQSRG
jgi:hypothetical protein